jgi:L-amino acid N-acyltransferase YncA
MTPGIRPSRPGDLAALCAIYAHHVRHGLATFEEAPPDVAELGRRRAELLARGLPHLVAELDGVVVGYAYAGPYRPRPAYRHTVEDSVYIAPGHLGRGAGRALLAQLIAACAAAGYRQMVAVIGDSANAPSIGLHAALGFRQVGVLRSVGFKLGRWVDTVLMQRPLGPGDAELPGQRG